MYEVAAKLSGTIESVPSLVEAPATGPNDSMIVFWVTLNVRTWPRFMMTGAAPPTITELLSTRLTSDSVAPFQARLPGVVPGLVGGVREHAELVRDGRRRRIAEVEAELRAAGRHVGQLHPDGRGAAGKGILDPQRKLEAGGRIDRPQIGAGGQEVAVGDEAGGVDLDLDRVLGLGRSGIVDGDTLAETPGGVPPGRAGRRRYVAPMIQS